MKLLLILSDGVRSDSLQGLDAAKETRKMIEKVICSLPEDYAVIITSDHGEHDRTHGPDIKEDMTIPVFLYGKPFEKDK